MYTCIYVNKIALWSHQARPSFRISVPLPYRPSVRLSVFSSSCFSATELSESNFKEWLLIPLGSCIFGCIPNSYFGSDDKHHRFYRSRFVGLVPTFAFLFFAYHFFRSENVFFASGNRITRTKHRKLSFVNKKKYFEPIMSSRPSVHMFVFSKHRICLDHFCSDDLLRTQEMVTSILIFSEVSQPAWLQVPLVLLFQPSRVRFAFVFLFFCPILFSTAVHISLLVCAPINFNRCPLTKYSWLHLFA